MNSNLKIIIIIIVVVLLVVAGYFLLLNKPKITTNTPANNTTSPSSTNKTEFPTGGSKTNFSIPSKDDPKMTLQIGEEKIETNNLYKNPAERFSDNSIAFVENNDYHMSFYPKDQGFLITLLNPDIQKARDSAEANLLSSLGITKDQACKLKVDLGTPIWVNEKAAGKNYGLSFCPNGKAFPK